MEAFEHIVKTSLSRRGYVVDCNVTFPVKRQTKRKTRVEFQTHEYEIDLVAANSTELLLVSAKSYLGSHGVKADELLGQSGRTGGYKLFNDSDLRGQIIRMASKRYGYPCNSIRLCLCAGKFYAMDESKIREELKTIGSGEGGSVRIENLQQIISPIMQNIRTSYENDPAVMAIKCLQALGLVK